MRVSSLADRPRLQLRLQERDRLPGLQAHWTDRCDYVEPYLFFAFLSLSSAAAAAAVALACCMQCMQSPLLSTAESVRVVVLLLLGAPLPIAPSVPTLLVLLWTGLGFVLKCKVRALVQKSADGVCCRGLNFQGKSLSTEECYIQESPRLFTLTHSFIFEEHFNLKSHRKRAPQ